MPLKHIIVKCIEYDYMQCPNAKCFMYKHALSLHLCNSFVRKTQSSPTFGTEESWGWTRGVTKVLEVTWLAAGGPHLEAESQLLTLVTCSADSQELPVCKLDTPLPPLGNLSLPT